MKEAGRGGRAGAEIWGKSGSPGPDGSRGTPDAVHSAPPPPGAGRTRTPTRSPSHSHSGNTHPVVVWGVMDGREGGGVRWKLHEFIRAWGPIASPPARPHPANVRAKEQK